LNHSRSALETRGLTFDKGPCTFEFGIVVEAFALPRLELNVPWYRFTVSSSDPDLYAER
jgi:hypothetical protein